MLCIFSRARLILSFGSLSLSHTLSLSSFCVEYKNSTKDKLDLESLLIMPIQRVPRYILLLRELAKATPVRCDT